MSGHYRRRRRQARSTSSTIIDITDPVSVTTTTPPAQTGRRETRCIAWANLALGVLIPLSIGLGTVLITLQQQKSEDRRFQQIQENEDRRREQDQQQADNLHYQDVYKTYISDISNAIFKQENQSNSFVDNRTRLDYIRSQTLITLLDLDCQRKTWLFQFLHENKLLPRPPQSTSLDLSGANLSCIRITKTRNLKKFEFDALVLSSVDLTDASFIEREFDNGVDFSGSVMKNIKFTQSRFGCNNGNLRLLFEHVNLSGADFSGAWLCNVNFKGADLSYAIFDAARFFQGTIDLTRTDLAYTTFKDSELSPGESIIITNANMTGALILEQKWFISAMNQSQIQIMDVILPNGTWLLNETKNFVQNGNAEKNCTSSVVEYTTIISDWFTFTSLLHSTLPTLSVISRNDALDSCYFNFTLTTADKLISMGQLIFFDDISVFIRSSEAEYHLSFDVAGCQGGFMQILLKIFSFVTTPVQLVFYANGTDQLHWEKRTISEKIRVDTYVIQFEIARGDHIGLCYVDNVEFYIRRSGSKK